MCLLYHGYPVLPEQSDSGDVIGGEVTMGGGEGEMGGRAKLVAAGLLSGREDLGWQYVGNDEVRSEFELTSTGAEGEGDLDRGWGIMGAEMMWVLAMLGL